MTEAAAVSATSRVRVRSFGFGGSGFRIVFWDVIVPLSLLLTASSVVFAAHLGAVSSDFRGTIWDPLHAVLAGANPYPAVTAHSVDVGNPSVYPPVAFFVALPVAWFPYAAAAAVWGMVLVLAVVAAIYIVGCRDVRCYVLVLLSLPVAEGLEFGNISLLLPVLVAAAWCWRDRAVRCGLALALAIALKLFLAPLVLWLVASRRYKGAAVAAGGSVLLVLGSWAVIGFDGLSSYPRLLRLDTQLYSNQSKSLYELVLAAGRTPVLALALALGMALAVAILAIRVGRRGDDSAAFALAATASLVASPLVWPHYYVVMAVPAAIRRTRLSWVWLLFPALWGAALLPRSRPASCCGPASGHDALWRAIHGSVPTWEVAAYVALLLLFGLSAVVRRPGRAAKARHPGLALGET